MKCSSPEGAANASRALHGRWFAGRFTSHNTINFAEFAACVIVTCFNVDFFFPLICRKTDHCQSCSSCKLPYYVPSSNVIVEAITAIHVLNSIFLIIFQDVSGRNMFLLLIVNICKP